MNKFKMLSTKFDFIDENKRRLQDKFKELARLADELSVSLEQASRAYRLFVDVTNDAAHLVEKSRAYLLSIHHEDAQLPKEANAAMACIVKQTCAHLEALEAELDACMSQLKQLVLKDDAARIRRAFELSGLVGEQLSRVRERRMHLMGILHERGCFVDMKLNEIESSLNRFRLWVFTISHCKSST